MTALIRAELRKLATTRAPLALIGVAFALAALRVLAVFINAGKAGAASLGTTASTRDLVLAPASAALALLVLGVLSVSTEVRYGTLTWAFLQAPDRTRVMLAKGAAVLGVSLAFIAIATVAVLGVAGGVFAARGLALDVLDTELLAVLAGSLLGVPLYAVLGVALGALVRQQVVAVVAPLLWFLLVETLLPSYGLRAVAVWLPGAAAAALARAELPGLLPMWLGGAVLVAWVAGLFAMGVLVVRRRDLT